MVNLNQYPVAPVALSTLSVIVWTDQEIRKVEYPLRNIWTLFEPSVVHLLIDTEEEMQQICQAYGELGDFL